MSKVPGLVCAALLATAFGCGSGYEADGAQVAEEPLAAGTYNFGAMASPGKCLDVSGNGNADGTNIQEWTCNGTGAQSIRVEDLGGGLARLVVTSSGKCVDVAGAGTADGTNVHLWTCNGTVAQAFRLEDLGGANVRIINAASNKCVDVSGAGTADGTNVQLWTCNGTNAQLWHLAAISPVGGGAGGGGSAPPPPPPTGGGSSGGWSSLPPRGDGVWVRVRNSCSFPLWIHGEGNAAVLQPDDAALDPGASRDYLAPREWTAARVTAFVDGPRSGELEKAEMTLTGGVLNYNVTYVDWVGLPLSIAGVGGNCNAAAHTTGCYAKESQILDGCPEGFLRQGKKCLSARTYCLDPVNQSSPYCHALDGAIASCAACPKASTPEVYACSGRYSQEPRMCAALNRGMTGDPDNANAGLYYRNPPYNTYAKWVHEVCPDIYAFSYDDWQSHGGFRACSGNELRITFCPSN